MPKTLFRIYFQKVIHSQFITKIELKIALALGRTLLDKCIGFKIKQQALISLPNNLSTVVEKLGMLKSTKLIL